MIFKGDLRRFHDYMAVEKQLSPRTATEYCRDIDRFKREAKVKRLDDISLKKLQRRLRSWFTGLMSDGSNKPQSVHRKMAALHAHCKWLVREGRMKKNPVDGIDRPKCEQRLPKCMTKTEVEQFLATIIPRKDPSHILRDKAMLELMYGAGLRRAEVCGVNPVHLDLDRKMLTVIGKGNKERTVFFGERTRSMLAEYSEARGVIAPSDPLFLTARNERMTVRQLWVIFKEYRDAAGLAKHVTPHTLRHSFATHLIENGADIVTVKELLGHSNIATTNTYTNVSKEHMRAIFDKSHPHAA